MKKLMIVAAVALCGAFAQAATVNWSANAIQSSPDVTVGADWLVQIYTSAVEYSYDAAKAGTITAWQTGATIPAGATFRATGSGSQTDGTTVNYYAVIYDASTVAGAKNYIISENVAVEIAEGGATGNLSFGAMNSTATTNKFLNSEWQSVPEPTSGLLLLIGVAGLALKRKRA